MNAIHVYAPTATAKTIYSGVCHDCKKITRFMSFFTPWHGCDATYLRCGRKWSDQERIPLGFYRGSRAANIVAAKRRYRAMPSVNNNHYGINVGGVARC